MHAHVCIHAHKHWQNILNCNEKWIHPTVIVRDFNVLLFFFKSHKNVNQDIDILNTINKYGLMVIYMCVVKGVYKLLHPTTNCTIHIIFINT